MIKNTNLVQYIEPINRFTNVVREQGWHDVHPLQHYFLINTNHKFIQTNQNIIFLLFASNGSTEGFENNFAIRFDSDKLTYLSWVHSQEIVPYEPFVSTKRFWSEFTYSLNKHYPILPQQFNFSCSVIDSYQLNGIDQLL